MKILLISLVLISTLFGKQYAVFALSEKKDTWYHASHMVYDNETIAKEKALQKCNSHIKDKNERDCKIVFSFYEGCAALALHTTAFGIASHSSEFYAKYSAISQCQKFREYPAVYKEDPKDTCRIVEVLCTNSGTK